MDYFYLKYTKAANRYSKFDEVVYNNQIDKFNKSNIIDIAVPKNNNSDYLEFRVSNNNGNFKLKIFYK